MPGAVIACVTVTLQYYISKETQLITIIREVGCGEGLDRGQCPYPEIFFDFRSKNVDF